MTLSNRKESQMLDKDEFLKQQASHEQETAFLVDAIPATLFRFYTKSLEVGFSEDQSFTLTRDYQRIILGQGRSNNDSE